MSQEQALTTVFDRIARGTHSSADIDTLKRMGIRGNDNAVVVGDHNIALHGSREVRIDNRVYHGGDAQAILAVLASLPRDDGFGVLRSVGGFVKTIGVLVALVGMGLFFYGLLSVMSSSADESLDSGGPPRVLIIGFAVAACGIGLGTIGGLIDGWSKPGRR